MNTYGLRYLYQNLGKVLKNLPFAITKHGEIIAVVHPPTQKEKKLAKKEPNERQS